MDRVFFYEVFARGGRLALNTALTQLADRLPQDQWEAAQHAVAQALDDHATALEALLDQRQATARDLKRQAERDRWENDMLRRLLSDDFPGSPDGPRQGDAPQRPGEDDGDTTARR
ncbi:hypothetical protein [Streptomyces sp. Ac-502]|uniref:hypothetical protein n=1 Tax=Streptomyces sp. Ac-502 TaxID=3342801 RepID=UPI003862555D